MARRSTLERSRARVKSDSSQWCRCRSCRNTDKRERSELGNTIADGVTFEKHTGSLKYLESTQVRWMTCARCGTQ